LLIINPNPSDNQKEYAKVMGVRFAFMGKKYNRRAKDHYRWSINSYIWDFVELYDMDVQIKEDL